jgi:hypothetical protein
MRWGGRRRLPQPIPQLRGAAAWQTHMRLHGTLADENNGMGRHAGALLS